MSKVIKPLATVIGTVAAIGAALTGVGIIPLLGIGISLSTIAAGAGLVAAAVTMFSKKPAPPSEARDRLFATLDPSAPRKIMFGETAVPAAVVYTGCGL